MAQVQVPATPAGAWFKDFLEVYNRFDPKPTFSFTPSALTPSCWSATVVALKKLSRGWVLCTPRKAS
jgi:hypothetical protein